MNINNVLPFCRPDFTVELDKSSFKCYLCSERIKYACVRRDGLVRKYINYPKRAVSTSPIGFFLF